MPSFIIHLAIAKKYLNNHPQENAEEFYQGVIAPDLKDKSTSHFGPYSSKPDLNRYCKEVGLETSYNRGYFLHLLTDDLFYNKYLKGFSSEIYEDYNIINKKLIEKYGIEIPKEIIGKVKFHEGNTKILNYESICRFIDAVGEMELDDYNRIQIDEQEEEK